MTRTTAKRHVLRCISLTLILFLVISLFPAYKVTAASNQETIFSFLCSSMGFNSAAACGVLANIEKESSFNPNAVGDGGNSYGICQWNTSRYTRLQTWCSNNGYSYTTLNGQLHYLHYELQTYYPSVYNYLRSVTNDASGAYNAAYYWCYNFEIPADKANKSVERGNLAVNTYWPRYGSVSSDPTGYSYNATAALAYAAEYWNKNSDQLCAEFVSRCVIAGGINISVIKTTTECANAICNATGLQMQELSLTSDGYATKALNEGRLAAGDVVLQNCKTHGTSPHILLCAGFDAQGYAVYYAHNSAMDGTKRYRLSVNTSYEHTTSCNMCGKAVHLSDNDINCVNLGEDFYAFIIKYSGWKHLEAADYNVQIAANGNNSQDPKQIWHFIRQDNGSYQIVNEYAGRCLDANGFGTEDGTNVGVVGDNGSSAQKWYILNCGSAYSLSPSYSTKIAIGVSNNNESAGTNIALYSANQSDSQIFSIYGLSNDGVTYSKPARPAAPSFSSIQYTSGTTVNIKWKTSPTLGKYDNRVYDLRIWKGAETTGNTYFTKFGITDTEYAIDLPKGIYTFSVAAVNTRYQEWYTFGDDYTKTLDPCSSGHNYTYEVTTIPTTSAVGALTGTCTKCSGTTTVTLPTLDTTNYNYVVVTVATCTANGTGRYTWKATTYGTFSFDVTIPKAAHSYTYAVTTAPTMSAAGVLTGTCSKCSGTITVNFPKLDTTNYNYAVVTPTTCTADGTGRYTWKTTTYGTFTFDVSVPKAGHSYDATVTAPNCTEQGYTTHICSACGSSYKDSYTAALGHDFGVWTQSKAPTCTEKGEEIRRCSRCNTTEKRDVDATGHKSGTAGKENEKSPTCTEKGSYDEVVRCTVCQTELNRTKNETAALGHDFGAWTQSKAPSCTEKGEESRKCSRCSATETRELAATGHKFENGVCIVCGAINSYGTPPVVFSDVPSDAYFAGAVSWAVARGVTTGTGDGKFSPNGSCTRAQVVTFLWRATGESKPKIAFNPFTDVKESAYYYQAVLWAVENGVTSGTSSNMFSPNGKCTRAQVVAFLWRAAGQPEPKSTVNPFTDVKENAYYYKAVLWAVENGVTTGTSKITFDPDKPCTRGQVVTFLYRAEGNK